MYNIDYQSIKKKDANIVGLFPCQNVIFGNLTS